MRQIPNGIARGIRGWSGDALSGSIMRVASAFVHLEVICASDVDLGKRHIAEDIQLDCPSSLPNFMLWDTTNFSFLFSDFYYNFEQSHLSTCVRGDWSSGHNTCFPTMRPGQFARKVNLTLGETVPMCSAVAK